MEAKRKYNSPKLVTYGSVRNLTGGSTATTTSDAGGSMVGGMTML